MKIKNEKPPIYDHILQAGLAPSDGAIYTYGDTIYNPTGQPIPPDLVEHEERHSWQQADDPDSWWGRYLDDAYFRMDQEAEAYADQYNFICKKVLDRNQQYRILSRLSQILASPMYGSVLSAQACLNLIQSKARKIR